MVLLRIHIIPLFFVLFAFFSLNAYPSYAAHDRHTVTASAVSPTSPLGVVQDTYNKIILILNDPSCRGKAALKKRREKISILANRIFDFRKVSMLALGRNIRKFTKKEFEEFSSLFTKILENTYVAKIETYSDAKIKFDRERLLTPKKAIVDTIVTYNGKEIPITYRFYKKGNVWLGYDVLVEGISLIKNYRTQFNDLLAREKPSEVIKLVRQKLEHQDKLEASKEEKHQ